MRPWRTFLAFFQALFPLIGFGFIGAAILQDVSSPYNIIVAVPIFLLGLYVSRLVFNMMRRRGYIDTMSGDNASYDADELEPTVGNDVLKLSPETLEKLFAKQKLNFMGGTTISIWGDKEGRFLDAKHKIESIEFNTEKRILTIAFSNYCLLKIKRPTLIFYTNSYLKIVKAKEVLWQTPNDAHSARQYSYLFTDKGIKTQSNTSWKPHQYDLGPGMSAVYLQG